VARLYARWVGTLVIDEADAALGSDIEALGMRCVITPAVMSDAVRATNLAKAVVNAL
jgi:hypothetical protein